MNEKEVCREKKNGQATYIAPLNRLSLLCSQPGEVQQELRHCSFSDTKITLWSIFGDFEAVILSFVLKKPSIQLLF
ncbi:MAG: hypothetical protein H6587_01215 [Flavobacteriales bacterium]|nr:hypothetical protein [Flavobacteriales bacterium]MCB9363165.1 hypothetical protein [Flavobacteriales bacterium]